MRHASSLEFAEDQFDVGSLNPNIELIVCVEPVGTPRAVRPVISPVLTMCTECFIHKTSALPPFSREVSSFQI